MAVALAEMLTDIEEHLCESVADLAGGCERSHVVAAVHYFARAFEDAVDYTGEPRSDSLHSAGHGVVICSLDD